MKFMYMWMKFAQDSEISPKLNIFLTKLYININFLPKFEM